MSDEQEITGQPEITEEILEDGPDSVHVRPHRPKRATSIDIDLVTVEKLAGMQCTDEEIADWFNIHRNLVTKLKRGKDFAEAVSRGRNKGKTSVRMALFREATGTERKPAVGRRGTPDYVPAVRGRRPNIVAIIFYAKNYLGMKDVVDTRHSGEVATTAKLDVSKISGEDLMVIRRILKKAQDDSLAGETSGPAVN